MMTILLLGCAVKTGLGPRVRCSAQTVQAFISFIRFCMVWMFREKGREELTKIEILMYCLSVNYYLEFVCYSWF